ncbi:hypothetical protein LTR09_009620 [Extremus antarcticus]|uniref:Transcription factor domain-containing protein n=1 Tax=Extremus antarcticus TaxID=702011 RepID=A0AAJ0GBN4_9PEZI|nr:hypothetical protein LTR09_009620 [Extremus antarcticus]
MDAGLVEHKTLSDVLHRIERLEQSLLPQQIVTTNPMVNKWLLTSDVQPACGAEINAAKDQDLEALESIATGHSFSLTLNAPNYDIRTTREILDGHVGMHASNGTIVFVALPPYRVTVLLFESFVATVEHVCYILHNASMRALFKSFYLGLTHKEPVVPSHAALTLPMLSLAAFFYQPFDASEIATTESECLQLSAVWGQCALRAMSHSQHATAGTLEDVQAHILMTYVAFMEGFSTLRHHHMGILSAMIDREIKRRVFWHIASTDWLESTMSGPLEGTYFLHPNHIRVNLPEDSMNEVEKHH